MGKKIALILMAFISYIGIGLIAPSMGSFAADFPEAAPSTVAMVVTTPAITMLLGLVVVSWLNNRIDRKILIVSAFCLAIFGGIMPAFLHSMGPILLCRGILGFGMGILSPLQITYFAEYNEGTRATLLGANGAVNGLLCSLVFLLIGLATLTWRQTFLVYGMFVVVLINFILFVPKDERKEATVEALPMGEVKEMGQIVYYYLGACLVMASYFIVPTTIAFYLSDHQLGGVTEAGTITALGTICMAVSGLAFPFLTKLFKRHVMTMSLFILMLGFLLYAMPNSLGLLTLAFGLIAFGQSTFAIAIAMALTNIIPIAKLTVYMAMFNGAVFLGQFISPYYQIGILTLIGTTNTARGYFAFGGVIMLLMLWGMMIVRKQSKVQQF